MVWVWGRCESLWERASPAATLEGKEGEENCGMVNSGWRTEAVDIGMEGIVWWVNMVCKDANKVAIEVSVPVARYWLKYLFQKRE